MSRLKPEVTKRKHMFGKIMGYTAQIGGWEAEGKTAAEAKENLEATILTATKRHYNLEYHSWRGNVLVMWTDPRDGLQWKVISPDGDEYEHGSSYGGSRYDSREEAESRALMHLAMAGWSHDDPAGHVPGFLPYACYDDFHSWCNFQRLYKLAQEYGMEPHECHAVATNDPSAPYNTVKAQKMLQGGAVVLSAVELQQLSETGLGNRLASAFNRNACGTKDTYVAWLGDNRPTDLEFRDDMAAFASAS